MGDFDTFFYKRKKNFISIIISYYEKLQFLQGTLGF